MSLALHTYHITTLCEFVLSFKNIDEVVATIKAATIKNNNRKSDFREAGLPSPPVPVITPWVTSLTAALHYSKNLPAVHTIVNNWTGEGLLARRAIEAINVDGLLPDLVRINQYRTLATNVELLEANDSTMTEAVLGTASFFLSPQSANPQPNFNILNPQPQVRNWTFESLVRNRKSTTTFQNSRIRNCKSATT